MNRTFIEKKNILKSLKQPKIVVFQHSKDFFRSHSSVLFHLQMSIFLHNSYSVIDTCVRFFVQNLLKNLEVESSLWVFVKFDGGYYDKVFVSFLYIYVSDLRAFTSSTLLKILLKPPSFLYFIWQLKYILSNLSLEVWFEH
jgi:hypothetical protein